MDLPSKVFLSADKGSPALSPAMLCGCRNDPQVSPPRDQERKSFVFFSRVTGEKKKSGEENQVVVSLSPRGAIALF